MINYVVRIKEYGLCGNDNWVFVNKGFESLSTAMAYVYDYIADIESKVSIKEIHSEPDEYHTVDISLKLDIEDYHIVEIMIDKDSIEVEEP